MLSTQDTQARPLELDLKPIDALALWHNVVLESVRREGPDLSARQMAILLTVYLTPPPHTVKGLSEKLDVTKPAITRALDTMGQMGLLKRRRDPEDKRNVLVQSTVEGSAFLSEFADLITNQTSFWETAQ